MTTSKPPTLEKLIHRIGHRVGRCPERARLLVRDMENSYLTLETRDDAAMDDLMGHSVSYRIAVGPHQDRKVFTLQTIPAHTEERDASGLAKTAGFSLHFGVAAAARQRDKLQRLCRYIAGPAVAHERLSLTRQGNVRYRLKTPYRDGTTYVIFEPLDFIVRLAALVPKPQVTLTHLHFHPQRHPSRQGFRDFQSRESAITADDMPPNRIDTSRLWKKGRLTFLYSA